MNKICPKCATDKPEEEFYRSSQTSSGYKSWCKQCCRNDSSDWYKNNSERAKALSMAWGRKNQSSRTDARNRWKEANPERQKASSKKWRAANKATIASSTARRSARKKSATPKWACSEAIKQLYKQAQEMTLLTGVEHHVDHIVPLRSALVTGLHCEANLRVIPAVDNYSKSNVVWPDMP